MRTPEWLKLMAPSPSLALGDGRQLRLLPAAELLRARREAVELAKEGKELALCSNACLVARALVRRGRRVYSSGQAVLEKLTAGEIQGLARRWAAFRKQAEAGAAWERGTLEQIKGSLERLPRQRLRWQVLRTFGALPTEERAKTMTEGDYLWCGVNLLLDEEETAAALCPSCRAEAEKNRCPVCGREKGGLFREENAAFDWARFEELKDGKA